MANKPAITLEIGAAVNPSVGEALNASKDSIDRLQAALGKAMVLDVDISKYLYAAAQLDAARRSGAASLGKLQSALDKQVNVLRAQGLEVKGLSAARAREVKDLGMRFEALGEAIKGYRLQVQGLEQITRGRAGLAAIPGLIKVAAKPVTVSADYQAQLRDISVKTGMDTTSEADVSREVIATSRSTGMSRSQLVQLLGQMIDNGMSLQAARDNLPTAATFAVGQNATVDDTAGLMRSLQLAKVESPAQVREALTLLVTQAKTGGFHGAELAKWVPKLLPGLEGRLEGVAAVGEIGALLQAQMSTANGTAEAAGKVGASLAASAMGGTVAGDPKHFTGDQDLLQKMRSPAGLTDRVLEEALQARQASSRQKWSQSEEALDDLQRSLGDGMSPVTDALAEGATYVLRKLTDLADACPAVVTALTGVAVTVMAVGAGYRSLQIGKGVLDLGKGLFKERGALKQKGVSEMLSSVFADPALGGSQPIDVRVVNWGALGRSGKGRRGRKRNAKVPTAQRPPAQVAGAGRASHAKTAGGKGRPANPGGFGVGFAGAPVVPAMRKQGPLPGSVMALSSGNLPVPASGHTDVAGRSPRLWGGASFSLVGGGLFKRLPGVSILDTGMQIVQTYQGNGTRQEKLEGYGTAAGGLGGALAGAAAGAAIGSVVPVLGTAIGGLIGGMLGGAGGERLGSWLAKTWSSGPTSEKPSVPAASLPTAVAASGVPPATVNQQFTFTSNMPVTFNNSLDDPSVLQQLEAIARRQLEQLMRQAHPTQMLDTPHITL